MKIKELIEQLSRGEGPENLEKYLEDFLHNNLNFGLSSSNSEEFTTQISGFSAEVNGQRPFAKQKSMGDASKVPEGEGEKPKVQVNTLLKSETLQKAFEISGEEMTELYQKAYHFYQEDRFDQSAVLFRWLVILNPFMIKFWMGLGSSQQLLDQHDKALHSYAIWSLLENTNPTPHFKAYECYQALDQLDESKKALCQALERAHQPNYNQLKQEVERCLQHLSQKA